MGKDLFEQFALARETFEEASDALSVNLKKLCFDGPESDLTSTENTQPCLLTVSTAAFRVWSAESGARPSLAAGHSLGEYSALVALGALSFSEAVRAVRERGQAMQQAVPAGEGTMAAVLGLDEAAVKQICDLATSRAREARAGIAPSELPSVEAWVEAANFNAPGQIAIAGSIDAVKIALEIVKSGDPVSGGKAVSLAVSAPFHSKLMTPARTQMNEWFSRHRFTPKTPSCAYIPNRTARPHQEAELVLPLLLEQIDHAVLWRQSMTEAMSHAPTHVLEFGPGKVLIGLQKRIVQGIGQSLQLTPPPPAPGLFALGDTAGLKTILEAVK